MTDRKSRRTILKAVASLPAVTFGLITEVKAKSVEEKTKKPPAAIFHEDDFSQEWDCLPFIVKGDNAQGASGDDMRGYVVKLPSGDFAAYSRQCRELGCKFEFIKQPAMCKELFDFEPVGPVLACHCHKSVFDLNNDGQVVNGPERNPLYRFAIKRCHDKVCILPFGSDSLC